MVLIDAGNLTARQSYLDAVAEGFFVGGDLRPTPDFITAARCDEEAFFQRILATGDTVTLPDGTRVKRPPITRLWWMDGKLFIGAIHIHHSLDSAMVAAYGGHLMYGIRPSRSRGGHAKRMLAAALPVAHALGIERAMACVRVGNVPSQKVLEANGGIFMDEIPIFYDTKPDKIRRYILPTTPAPR